MGLALLGSPLFCLDVHVSWICDMQCCFVMSCMPPGFTPGLLVNAAGPELKLACQPITSHGGQSGSGRGSSDARRVGCYTLRAAPGPTIADWLLWSCEQGYTAERAVGGMREIVLEDIFVLVSQ